MSLEDLKSKDVDALRAELLELRQTQMKLRLQKASGQLQQTHQIRNVRRDIARIKTLLTQKKVRV
ncbi:50S ribosomal protein L29 [Dichelobacter nodosus]|uniref:Large ribosomal subunit protein uL29 n=1 Tax=Dichelobacter nodosus (strain VCS1703A) TaxID=246195 RepID=RL29_DICNV|nr:50S ribosomal protein L29 [Dichelobacter nodosus]A5EX91.1 RecName: Full=Large ribosomal subunit protein uL29; AltName: Full=50S ribosomal protein L29 [Dichelobacter nodosus VCS1703A]ABQ13314.1 50S ribosomal protein L29 [Dichelobacter nodosus VCS1703A]AXM46026.1 50S ribosomal protein L29 [Dichelobacter nodosus]KNZ39473.1 50S ribosomal protein L29 [Dichelobacter nodosus]TGA65298.1 50S ribosomal protein L29 [Dichelobacter nodosus]